MNYQLARSDSKTLPSITLPDAMRMGLVESPLCEYHAWPELFGSTCGPFSGIGGQAISTFTMEAYVDYELGIVLVFCGGRVVRRMPTDQFIPYIPQWKNVKKASAV